LWFSVHPAKKVLYSPKMGFQLNVDFLPVNPEKKYEIDNNG
jgi:hypothetical protein